MATSDAFERVKAALLRALKEAGLPPREIQLESSLIAELGFTSLLFVDLTLALEDAFQFGEFPMQEWIDEQNALDQRGFRVQSLVDKCQELMAGDV